VIPHTQRAGFVTSRPVAILMVFLAAVVFGWLSYGRLPVTLMPELTYPTLTVRTEYPGSAPEEVENDISRPIEEQLGVIGGLAKISSVSRAGLSDVVLEFAWDTDMSEATQDVLEKLDLVFLPEEAKRPLILHYDPSLDPVMELSLSGEGPRFEGEAGLRRLRRLAELRLKKEIEPVKGVAAVRVRGGLEEEIHVAVEEEALRRTGISIQQVIERLAQENINVAGGTLKEGRTEYLVRTLNEYQGLGQIGETVVATVDGREVRIRDLGEVRMSHKEREILTRTDAHESVQVEIYKEGDANIVALAHRVKAMLGPPPDEEREEPAAGARRGRSEDEPTVVHAGLSQRIHDEEGARLQVVADRSLFIESSINEVRNTAILGGMLAVLILYFFMRNFKSTAIIAVSIPISLLITFAPLNLLGVSLNIMSLGGLALGIGMLVDSSIVVLESIYRCREEGDDEVAAANRGASEVRAAVLASTFTSIAVFFPMVFVEGIAGQAFGDLGFAVVVSLLAAAAVALFFIPMLASRRGLGAGNLTWSYFDSEAWKQSLDAWSGRRTWLKIVSWPVFALQSAWDLHRHYVAPAWKGLVADYGAAGRWGKFGGCIYWLAGVVLALVLPWVFLWLRSVVHFHGEKVASAWAELARDFSATPLAVRIPTLPFWIFRILLVTPLPYLFHSASWRAVRTGFARTPWWGLLLVAPFLYWTIRYFVGVLFEALGQVILTVVRLITTLVSGFLVPVLAAVFSAVFWVFLSLTGKALDLLKRVYPPVLRAAMDHPAMVVVVVLACFGITWQVTRSLGSELLPEVHQGEFMVEVALPVGTPIEETEIIVAPIEQAILAEKEQIRSLILTVGYDSTNTRRSDEGEHTAAFKVLLEKSRDVVGTEQQVTARLRERFEGIPDLEARIVRPVLFSSKTPIEVEVQGDDLIELRRHGDEVATVMASLPELADVESSLRRGAPEVQIVYDRDRLARYDMNIQQVAQLVRNKVQGYEATRYNLKDRRIPIVVRLAMDDRETVDDVRSIIVNPGGERPISLASVAEVTLGEGPSEVRRVDSQRVALIRANIASGSLSAATWRIENELHRRIEWPADMGFLISGQYQEWERSRKSLWVALALSVFLVYVIMASQFESLIHPLVIMLTIPLAFVGTVLALKLLDMRLSIVVFLGMIMLAGIVVNNAIVLVDYINTLRRRGLARDEAVITAGKVRLRPILMTTATTVLGLTPMALGLGDGAEIRTPMAVAVISGLITSTALTLIVIPSIYVLADRLKMRLLGGETVTDATLGGASLPEPGADTVTP
jgi:HAE1 family hydrophobic/amphiphilic exporter-1